VRVFVTIHSNRGMHTPSGLYARPMRWPVGVLLVLAACGGGSSGAATHNENDQSAVESIVASSEPGASMSLSIGNQGGDLEGPGPRGFAGQGIGLFAGDNLNAGFPEKDGVQIWLSFDLPAELPVPTQAMLRSSALSVNGDPLASLGGLNVEPVTYDAFELFDLAANAAAVRCSTEVAAGEFECDATSFVADFVKAGATRAQFRIVFDQVADNDGEQDVALFFLTDSNTNEPGIFQLELS
jgi:hypothetical protein